jgi:hypothetical protein
MISLAELRNNPSWPKRCSAEIARAGYALDDYAEVDYRAALARLA